VRVTFVLEDEVRSVAGYVVVGRNADLDPVGGRRVDDSLSLRSSPADRQLADAAASTRRQLFPDERVQRAARTHVAGRTRPCHVEIQQRQPDLSSVVGLY